MRTRFTKWGGLPLVAIVAMSCSDANPTGPDLQASLVTVPLSSVVVGEVTSVDLFASQDDLVGSVEVTHLGGGEVQIEYLMDAGYCLTETHWAADYDVGNLVNRGGNPQIGRFPYGDDQLDCVTSYTETGTITGSVDGDYVVAAHGVVEGAGAGDGSNPYVTFGIFDAEGDGGETSEEGDIYGVNPTTGALELVADIPNDAGGDPFDPNGLALDRTNEELFFVSSGTVYKVPASNADPLNVTPTMVRGVGDGLRIRSATIDGGYYYWVANGTDDLYRLPIDGSADAALYCELGEDAGLWFGDVAADPAGGTIYGVARVGDGSTGNVVYFTVDVDGTDDCVGNDAVFVDPTTYDFQLQIAFGDDGTLYGQEAISEPGPDEGAGQWWELDAPTGEITMTLAQTVRSFTDIAGGLPLEPVEYGPETAWGSGELFRDKGSWATYMGPFSFN